MAAYTIPRTGPVYAKFVDRKRSSDGKTVSVWTHYYRQADGRNFPCTGTPNLCRECYREKNWSEGQTHG